MARLGSGARPLRRLLACATAACAVLLTDPAASADTTIGQTLPAGSTAWTCFFPDGADTVQTGTAAGGPSYSLPSAGRVTSWSTEASSSSTATLQLEIWRPTAVSNAFTLVGTSQPETIVAGSGLNTFTLAQPIAAEANDLLGLRMSGTVACAEFVLQTADVYRYIFPTTNPAPGSSVVFPYPHGLALLNVSATVAPGAPTSKQQCFEGGWQQLTDNNGTAFKNEGDCVSFVATLGRNPAG
jgi:hypothetical protein